MNHILFKDGDYALCASACRRTRLARRPGLFYLNGKRPI